MKQSPLNKESILKSSYLHRTSAFGKRSDVRSGSIPSIVRNDPMAFVTCRFIGRPISAHGGLPAFGSKFWNGRNRPSLVENDAAQSCILFVGPRLSQKQPWQRLGQVTVLRQVLRRKINGSIISMPELPTVSQKQMFSGIQKAASSSSNVGFGLASGA
jgi:hypothetical protein